MTVVLRQHVESVADVRQLVALVVDLEIGEPTRDRMLAVQDLDGEATERWVPEKSSAEHLEVWLTRKKRGRRGVEADVADAAANCAKQRVNLFRRGLTR